MKKLLTILLLSVIATGYSQSDLKQYTYAMHISDNNFSSCTGVKVVYFSPIVSYTFEDDYRIFDKKEVQGGKIATRWENKVEAYYSLSKDFCFNAKTPYWEKSYSAIDSERDKWIRYYKNQGYKVYTTHSFSFN